MAVIRTISDLKRLPKDTKVTNVSYRNNRRPTKGVVPLHSVDLRVVVAFTVLFKEPRWYLVNGDEAIRSGYRVVVRHGS